MDKKALLKRLKAVLKKSHSDLKLILESYEDAKKWEKKYGILSQLHDLSFDDNALAREYESREKIDTVIRVAEKYSENLSDKIEQLVCSSDCFIQVEPSLRIYQNRNNFADPVARNDGGLIRYQYNDAAKLINELNEKIINLEGLIGIIEKIETSSVGEKLEITYLPERHILIVNGNKIVIGTRGERTDLLLRVFFKNKRHNLLSGEVCDGDIFEEMEFLSLKTGKTKAEKRKYILDGYRKLNNDIRKSIPNGEDLVIRIENGFILNPKLKS